MNILRTDFASQHCIITLLSDHKDRPILREVNKLFVFCEEFVKDCDYIT